MTEIRVDSEITLRTPTLLDAERLFELVNSNRAHLREWLPGLLAVKTVEQERKWLQERIADTGGEKPLLIIISENVVGVIGAHIQEQNAVAEVGYWLAEGQQGRGITTRSCAAIVDELLRVQGMNRIVIRSAVENTRSRAVPERLGFVHEGVERQAVKFPDGFVDMAVYSMLASEWRGAQAMGFVDPSGRPLTFGAPPILIDNQMMLRRPRATDAEDLYALLDSNRDRLEWWSAWSTRVRTREDATELIRSSTHHDEDLGSPLFVYNSGVLVGALNVEPSKSEDNGATADVRYWIGGEWEGRGLMIRACRAAVDAAIAHFELAGVTIHAGAGNMRARALAERLGFQILRVDRGASATEDVIVYSVSAADWAENATNR
ncbi:MAG: GNAT family protein [Dehalococcoidia bacterium]|nr:GNAT family protein [Dehalococcoidia bacterium]